MQLALCRAAGNPHAAVELVEHSRLSWLLFGADVFCYGPERHGCRGGPARATAAAFPSARWPVPRSQGRLSTRAISTWWCRRARCSGAPTPDSGAARPGRHMLVALDPSQLSRIAQHRARFSLRPVVRNQVVFDVAPRPDVVPALSSGTRQIIDRLSRSRYVDTLIELASYPARHSLSSHFHDAARRARDRLQMMGYEARLDEVVLAEGKTLNVVADKRGTAGDADKVTLVAAHSGYCALFRVWA